jgi:hypothetical protein
MGVACSVRTSQAHLPAKAETRYTRATAPATEDNEAQAEVRSQRAASVAVDVSWLVSEAAIPPPVRSSWIMSPDCLCVAAKEPQRPGRPESCGTRTPTREQPSALGATFLPLCHSSGREDYLCRTITAPSSSRCSGTRLLSSRKARVCGAVIRLRARQHG